MDTDAAGIYHWTTVFRLAEAAEAELHTALGIAELTFGAMPRISANFNFKRPLRFNDPVEIVLQVDQVSRSSIRYTIQVLGPDGLAANGRISACLIDRESGSPIGRRLLHLFGGVDRQAGAQTRVSPGCRPSFISSAGIR